MNERLYRSREDRLIGGVCAGLGDRLDIDPSLVRIGWVLATLFTGGAFLVVYIVMLVVVPEEPLGGIPPVAPPTGPGAVPGWQGPEGWTAPGGTQSEAPGWMAPGDSGAGTPTGDAAWGASGAAATSAAAEAQTATAADAAGTAGAPAPAWIAPDQAYASRRAARAERRRRNEGVIGLVFGLLLILLGAWFLLREYVPEVDLESFWPIAIIALGVLLLVLAFRPGRRTDAS